MIFDTEYLVEIDKEILG